MNIQTKLIAGFLIAAAAPVLVGCGETRKEQPQEVLLETTDARLSYGIGLRMGQRMAADGMTVDVRPMLRVLKMHWLVVRPC